MSLIALNFYFFIKIVCILHYFTYFLCKKYSKIKYAYMRHVDLRLKGYKSFDINKIYML